VTTMNGDAVVKVRGLRKSFGHLEVLKGIDMEVHQGEVVVIFGRSGSGKSTLLRCINFLEDPTEGTIEVAGIHLAGGHRTRHKREEVRKLREEILPSLLATADAVSTALGRSARSEELPRVVAGAAG